LGRDPEHGPVAAIVFGHTDDVGAAPPAGLAGEHFAQAVGVGQASGGGGDERSVPPVGFDAGEVVGFAACGWKWSSLRAARIVVLEDLFVAEQARGRGHAEALIEATARIARRHGAPAVTWLTAPDNRRAQAVYERVGGRAQAFLEYELEL